VTSFMYDVSLLQMHQAENDAWIWKSDSSGIFSVRNAYAVLAHQNFDAEEGNFFKYIWKVSVPSNVTAFVWKLSLDRVQTRVNLKRGMWH